MNKFSLAFLCFCLLTGQCYASGYGKPSYKRNYQYNQQQKAVEQKVVKQEVEIPDYNLLRGGELFQTKDILENKDECISKLKNIEINALAQNSKILIVFGEPGFKIEKAHSQNMIITIQSSVSFLKSDTEFYVRTLDDRMFPNVGDQMKLQLKDAGLLIKKFSLTMENDKYVDITPDIPLEHFIKIISKLRDYTYVGVGVR